MQIHPQKKKRVKKHSADLPSGLFVRGASLLLCLLLSLQPVTATAKEKDPSKQDGVNYKSIYAQEGYEDYEAEMKANRAQPIQTNEVPSWPKGPRVNAASAVVMDADSGTVLYAKNSDMKLYPASITKLMTGLLAYENLEPSDIVSFSQEAVFNVEPGSSHIGLQVGESITVDQALYGLMVASANEVANALGERVSGTQEAFVSLMNERALQLGCENTHFVTINGLHDPAHYTTAYDMALIAREMYRYPDLIEYMSQSNYHIEPTDTQPDDIWMGNTDKFLTGEIPYDHVVAGKTGYTDESRQTLVTFAKHDGLHLICVVLREERPSQYYDTIELLDYAFDHFRRINATKKEDGFQVRPPAFLSMSPDLFGDSSPIGIFTKKTYLTIPKDAAFEDLEAEIVPARDGGGDGSGKKTDDDGTLGIVHYKFNGYEVGTAGISFDLSRTEGQDGMKLHGIRRSLFGLVHTGAGGSVHLNLLLLVPLIFLIAYVLTVIFCFTSAVGRKKKKKNRNGRKINRNTGRNSSRNAGQNVRRNDGQNIRRNAGQNVRRNDGQNIRRNTRQNDERDDEWNSGQNIERADEWNSGQNDELNTGQNNS